MVRAISDPLAIYTAIEEVRPALILIDLWMPVLNGAQIVEELKKTDSTKKIPIIIISANKDTETIAQAAGVADFLCKPFDINDLENMVARHILLHPHAD